MGAGDSPVLAWPDAANKFLVVGCLRGFFREGRAPQFEAAIQAVHRAEALADQVGGALAGVAVVAGDDQWQVEIGPGDEIMQRVIVQVLRAFDMAGGEALRVADGGITGRGQETR